MSLFYGRHPVYTDMGVKIYVLCQQESVVAVDGGDVYPWDKYLTRKFVFQNTEHRL